MVSTGAAGDMAALLIAGGVMDGATPVELLDAVVAVLSSCERTLLVESLSTTGRRAPRLRNSGGAMITIAVSNNARKKRLSIGSGPETDRL